MSFCKLQIIAVAMCISKKSSFPSQPNDDFMKSFMTSKPKCVEAVLNARRGYTNYDKL